MSQATAGNKPAAGLNVSRGRRLRSFEELGVLMVLVAMVAVVSAFHPEFLNITSVSSLLQQAAAYGIIAVGMVYLLVLRDVDLSVGNIMGLVAICCAELHVHGMNTWVAAGLALLIGAALGLFNGVISNAFKLPLIIVTLGTLSMFQGLALVITEGNPVAAPDTSSSFFRIFGGSIGQIPASVFVLAAVAAALWFAYRKSAFAFSVRAVGSNPEAAELSGYPTNRIRLYVVGGLGLLAGLTGVLSYAYFGSVDPSLGNGLMLQVIAAAVIGGTGLHGGRGSVPGAVLGALIISVITGALSQFGVSINWANFVTGAVIVAAVSIDSVIKRRQSLATA